MPIAVNPQTGEVVIWDGSQWSAPPAGRGPPGRRPPGGNAYEAFGEAARSRLDRAMTRGANLALGMARSPLRLEEPDPDLRQERLQQTYPRATSLGQMAPYLIPVPGGIMAQMAAGAAMGGAMEDDPRRGAVAGALTSGAGYGAGAMAGRVVNAIRGAGKGAIRRLPSGIRQSAGEASGDPTVAALEESLGRNAITGRPLARIADANKTLLHSVTLSALKQEGGQLTETAVGEALETSVAKIRAAVPDEALIEVGEGVRGVVKRFNALPDEIIELPEAELWTGAQFRNARSDVLGLTRSPKASVRERARRTLELLDEAAESSGKVDAALYREGREEYRVYSTLTEGSALKPSGQGGELEVNLAALDRNLERAFGKAATKGGKSTGIERVDKLIATVRDARRVRDFTAGSVTTKGLSVPLLLGDVAATGGLLTGATYASSEALQSAPMMGFLTGLRIPAPVAGEVGATLLRPLTEKSQ